MAGNKQSGSYFFNAQNLTNQKQESASHTHTYHTEYSDPLFSFYNIIPQQENKLFISQTLISFENSGTFVTTDAIAKDF